MPKKQLRQCPVCGKWKKTVSVTCSIKCARQAFPQKTRHVDPTPEEISSACAEIRAGWSEEEKRRRQGLVKADRPGIKIIPAPRQSRRGFIQD